MSETVLLIGDIHAMDRAPSGRTETYPQDILDKLAWLAEYCRDNDIKHSIWAGDVFHHKQPSRTSHATVLRMIEVIQYFNQLGVEVAIVVGNHDVSNDVLASVGEKQPLGVLLRSGAVELDGWHPAGLPVYGVGWQQRWHHEGTIDSVFIGWREDPPRLGGKDLSKSLVVTHAPIYPPDVADDQMFELLDTHEIATAMQNTGYLFYGHIHEDHGVFEVDGVTFANHGAISRGSLHEYNLTREVKATLWSPEKGFSAVKIPVKPAEEVFRIEQHVETKNEKLSLDNFLAKIGSSTLDISSTESVVAHIRTLEGVEPSVKKTAIEILEEVG